MPSQAMDDAERWYVGVVLTYCAISPVDGHTPLFLGLFVPHTWVSLMHSHGRLGPWLTGAAHLSLFALVALIAAVGSRLLDRGDWRRRGLQTFSVFCLALSAIIACCSGDVAAFTLMTFMPFAGAVFGYVLFSLGRPPAN